MEELDKNKSGNPMEGEARGTMSIEEFLKKGRAKKTCSVFLQPDR